MYLTKGTLESLSAQYGDSFYLMDSHQFITNYQELLQSFRDIYPNTHIAYSYKTNYIPKLCKLVDLAGGFAEVVSEMELELSKRIGVPPKKVFFNGPYKNKRSLERAALPGGTINLDSWPELEIIKEIAFENPEKQISVGIRCNFDIGEERISRFGFDVEETGFKKIFDELSQIPNLNIHGLHCHYPTRNLESFIVRARKMISLTQKFFEKPPVFISIGGGFFGRMPQSLVEQFGVKVPTYQEYANAVAPLFRSAFPESGSTKNPKLIIEPGTAIVADTMRFVARVVSIKTVRGQAIATLTGSVYNINPTLNNKNMPIAVMTRGTLNDSSELYSNLDMGGYSCIESDYLFRYYSGPLRVGDFVVFENVGSYSVVLKPPFILPNVAILEVNGEGDSIEVIKEKETFEDIFHTFYF